MKDRHWKKLTERVDYITKTVGQNFINVRCSAWAKEYVEQYNHGRQLPRNFLENQTRYIYVKIAYLCKEMKNE